MKLKLLKVENRKTVSIEEIKFKFFKNIIKKDLELASWSNNAVKVFGDFQIYSDYKAELNSFEQIVTFITGEINGESESKLECYFSSQCIEYFFNLLVLKGTKLSTDDLDNLSIKFTKYILEVTSISNVDNSHEEIRNLDMKYFGTSDLGSFKQNTHC